MSLPVHSNIIQKNVSLADKNWFGTGGCAEYFANPSTIDQLQDCFDFVQKNNLSLTVIGTGANILIADEGVTGLVIKIGISEISIVSVIETTVLVAAGAGCQMEQLIAWCFEHNVIGLHEFSGIPSSVGGALYINLHFFQFLIDQFVVSALLIDTYGKLVEVDKDWFEFRYNYSRLHEKEYFVISVTFKLSRVDPMQVAFERGRSHEIKRYRAYRYPSKNTCGSFFRNFCQSEVTLEHQGKKVIWAAYYLDQAGVKGVVQCGAASVSTQHANMIVVDHTKKATSNDIVACALLCQKLVLEKFNIRLLPECQLIGFKDTIF